MTSVYDGREQGAKMNIKLHSFGNPDSYESRCILEGMYRRLGEAAVKFPDDNTIELDFEGNFDTRFEYGIHRIVRVSPRHADGLPRTSYVMVEIDGKKRDFPICSYVFHPYEVAKNYLNKRETCDLMGVLGGKPLGLRRIEEVKPIAVDLSSVFAVR